MAYGLLKAISTYCVCGTPLPDQYENRPAFLGCTIAFGEFPDEWLELVGTPINIAVASIVAGPETVFYTASMELPIESKIVPHVTLGWVEGSVSKVAGDECRRYFNGDPGFVEIPCRPHLIDATIEFKPFSPVE
jgi:hypothetical protein